MNNSKNYSTNLFLNGALNNNIRVQPPTDVESKHFEKEYVRMDLAEDYSTKGEK